MRSLSRVQSFGFGVGLGLQRPGYAPPESLPDSIFSPVSGVWSFGAGLCELFFACGRASQQKRPRNPPPAMAEGNHKRLPLQPDDAPFRPLL
ncbi:tyrosine-protein kinase JAK3-like isoform X6 [Sceloporus undulatus]|uniref:tyrosine-protein kinase JAK3-like isoform X6 n=1 Tax=Sceloporus undulatus TaxID=8520 RepID=UPI001C4C28D3|nr:tyrosine-protein kinase JAK3-like isoform X6 [Sceloporus undulatus]